MKATGIIRRVDDLGRVVIPKEIRRTVHIREGDPLEIFVEDGGVLFKPYRAIDNYEAAFEMACRLLQWSGVKHYTVYDRHAKVANYNMEKQPDYPEPQWFDMGHEDYDKNTRLWVYPVFSEGEVMGFIVSPDNDNDIQLAVNYLEYEIGHR